MTTEWGLLVVSPRLETKRQLLGILRGLPVNTFTASTVAQAREALASHYFQLIFSEENFADGSYRDLLNLIHVSNLKTSLVLMLCTGEWEEYLEGLRSGADEVIRCPLQPTDVELSLIRASRREEAESKYTTLCQGVGASLEDSSLPTSHRILRSRQVA